MKKKIWFRRIPRSSSLLLLPLFWRGKILSVLQWHNLKWIVPHIGKVWILREGNHLVEWSCHRLWGSGSVQSPTLVILVVVVSNGINVVLMSVFPFFFFLLLFVQYKNSISFWTHTNEWAVVSVLSWENVTIQMKY